MKRILVLLSLLTFIWGISPGYSQDYSGIFKSLEDINKRLDNLEAAYRKDFSRLNERIRDLRLNTPELDMTRLTELENVLADLESRTVSLENESAEIAELGIPNEFRNQETGVSDERTAEGFALDITGFGDAITTFEQNNTEGDYYGINQAEVDLETNLNEKLAVAAAIAWGEEAFELAVFTVDFHLFGLEGDHIRTVEGIDRSGIIAGRFDVPFGIDYKVYASIDRKLVSAPLVVENTHDGWNDHGIQAYVETPWANAVVFGVNGFGYEWTEPAGTTEEIGAKTSFGGRVGITPNDLIEVGGSYAGFINENSDLDMALIGADLQFNIRNFVLKGEFITHRMGLSRDEEVTNYGFYSQGLYDFGPIFVVGRFGLYSPDEEGADDFTRVSGGIGWKIYESCEMRFEYQANSGDTENKGLLQLVAGF